MGTIYKTFDVALELKQTSTNAPFYVIEGDNGNKIRITVTDGGSAVDLTDCRVIAVFSKSNGTSMQDSAEANGGVTIGGTYNNEVTVALRSASIAPGQVECELQIYSDENKTTLITTAKFNFECQRAIFNEDTAMATNEYPILVSLISVCNGIVAAEEGRVSAENTRVLQEQERQAEILKIAGMTVEVTTLAAGAQATAELVESGDHKVLKLGIPKGQDGSGTGDMSKSTYDKDNDGVVDKADDADKLGGKAASEYQPAAVAKIVSLAIANWAGEAAPFSQTITVEGMTAEAKIIVSPVPASLDAYGSAQVRCTEQAANSLTFACSKVPESNLTVNILIVG